MAGARERPWTRDEKNHILAEIIKSHSPDPAVMLNIIHNLAPSPQPNWNELALPFGRSVNDCKSIWEDMRRRMPQPGLPPSSLATPSGSTLNPNFRRSIAESHSYSGGREIRPKPTPTSSFGPSVAADTPIKRKRGRPTNASLALKKAEEDARTTHVAGPATPLHTATPLSQVSPVEVAPPGRISRSEEKPSSTSLSGRMQIGSILTNTPDRPTKSSSHSSSSSGKRRRVRLTRSEEEPSTGTLSRGQGMQRISSGGSLSFDESLASRPAYLYPLPDPGTPSRSSPRASHHSTLAYPPNSQPPGR